MRSEYAANVTLQSLNRATIGANFSKPAPLREVSRPAARLGYVLSLCCALIGAAVVNIL